MEQQIRQIINEVFYDLQEACGEDFDAQDLADCVGDRMFDTCEEYRMTPWQKRREITLQIAREYV